MILRRFMLHIREQNWFAVGLDVTVVIVGIFLGLQVQEAYENQAERAQELIYLNQLHEEIIDVKVEIERRFELDNRDNEGLFNIATHFSENIGTLEFSDQNCRLIANSHILASPRLLIPTINELISSGQVTIIQDQELRSLVLTYEREAASVGITADNVRPNTKELGALFPDIIKIGAISETGNSSNSDRNHKCDFTAMYSNQAFKNNIIGNSARFNAIVRRYPEPIKLLEIMHEKVDQLLNINHLEAGT